MSILIALLVLSFLVFFHELGHFFVARLCGVSVEVFSIGFGKKIARFHWAGTEWAVSAVPLGGYVKLKGQDDSKPTLKDHSADSYMSKTPLQRIAILLAGPAFNLLLAFLIYVGVGFVGKMELLPIVGEVRAGYPADLANLRPGDKIVAVNAKAIQTWSDLDSMITTSSGTLNVDILRGNSPLSVQITPIMQEGKNIFGESIMRRVIGIVSSGESGKVQRSGVQALFFGVDELVNASTLIVQGIIKLISGVLPSSEVGGVVSIVSVIGEASHVSFISLLWLSALISVNLGILNLLPIPALDGGHIVFNLYEFIMRKAPNEQVMYYLTLCGWAILLLLMFFGLYNDIFRLLG